jgi:Fe-S-cluster-containing dehydrogenase component/DMSO reductase anchor subunit
MSRNYFKFDENRCVGCEACVVACVLENGFQYPEKWRNIYSSNSKRIPDLPLHNLSLACNHCDEAPCMKHCPSLAYKRDLHTGAILIESEKCIGCSYCLWNCPYEAPKYNPVSKVIEKCDFCTSRIIVNIEPACSSHCPVNALEFSFSQIDKSSIKKVINVPGNPKPSLVIKKLENDDPPLKDTSLFESNYYDNESKKITNSISLKSELPLLIFTFIVALMVPLSAMNIVPSSDFVYNLLFILSGIGAATISLLHLGNKALFWRSVLNIKQSWLSREIAFFAVYLCLSFVDLFLYEISTPYVSLFGLATLVSIDMVYRPLQWKWKTQWHSGQVLFISASVFLLLSKIVLFLIVLMIIRIIISFINDKQNNQYGVLKVIRFLLPTIFIIMLLMDYNLFPVVVFFIIGEFIDRLMFYSKLEITTVNKTIEVKK